MYVNAKFIFRDLEVETKLFCLFQNGGVGLWGLGVDIKRQINHLRAIKFE